MLVDVCDVTNEVEVVVLLVELTLVLVGLNVVLVDSGGVVTVRTPIDPVT